MPTFLSGIDAVKQHLMDQGELVMADGPGFILRAEPRGNIGRLTVFEPRPGELRFVLLQPLTVPAEQLGDFALRLARVNAQLGIGLFQLRQAQDGLTAAFSVYAYYNHDGTISDLVVDRCVNACRVTVDHFLPELFPAGEGTSS